ncbi:MAG TPA: clostripain-related cysteine peptidase [Bryobacteraceae bacterium]|nr:clostripain-related cysteine peptidase [Bryobacteraceae bacterium]
MVRFLLLACLAFTLDAQVKINEVLFYNDPNSQDAFRTNQWLELFNAGSNPVDLTGWSVTASDGVNGARARALPSVLLPAGAYLVVHFASGNNSLDFTSNSGDYYTGDAAGTPYWSVDSDEAALYSPGTIVDFIDWARSSVTYAPGQAHLDAVAAGIWTMGSVLLHDNIGSDRLEVRRFVDPGDSIGRDPFSSDSDTVGDFNPLGGPSSLGPTPGQQNLAVVPIAPPAAPGQISPGGTRAQAAVAPASWTVLAYMSADNNLEGWFVRKICRLQQAGGSTANVNFVVMLDLKNMPDPVSGMSTTYRGLLSPAAAAVACNSYIPGTATAPSVNLINPGLTDIGERDMGDPNELSAFIAWGQQNYPAAHYGLILSSHGGGWKGFGPDETFPTGTRQQVDTLYMGELSTALNGQNFDWIVFDACLMAGVEVAHQLKPYANYMLASEEITWATDFPYESLAQDLAANPNWNALQSITDIFNQYVANTSGSPSASIQQGYTVSVSDLTKVNDLSVNIRAWSDLLAPGMSLFQGRDDPSDNVQILTRNQVNAAEKFWDNNFIDLYDFAKKMQTSGVPNCLLSPVASILDAVANRVVVLESHGANHPNAHGLHIYFPSRRMINVGLGADGLLPKNAMGLTAGFYYNGDFPNQPYDLPYTRTFDGTTPFAHYGVNADQLPMKARDPETGVDFDLPGNGLSIVWPLPQSPNFLFPNDTGWRKVLDRYYHPVADNHILPVTLADGTIVNPTQTGGGACANPMDSITVPVGTTVTFSAKGSSDADLPFGTTPVHRFWDKDDKTGCLSGCIAPFQVGAGTDAANATTNMDAERDVNFTTFDQNDGDGATFTRVCGVPGQITVTLIPWDDDHLFPFHNTIKTADYVHPQSGLHQATVNCTSPVTLFPTSGTLIITFTVITDTFSSDPYVGLGGQMATVHFTTSSPTGGGINAAAATQTITLTGDRPAIPNGTGTYDPTTGTWNATILASGSIAGFPNVQVKWLNMQFTGSGNNSITGTYQVGTNGNLNGESPIVYKVTGTVTRQ